MRKLLQRIIANPKLHARWLSSLSSLELSGAQKLARVAVNNPTADFLRHTAEEFRHAWFFKRQIQKLGGDPKDGDESLLSPTTRRYLSLIELHAVRWLKRHQRFCAQSCYLLTSYAVELRAEQLYTCYEDLLRTIDHPLSLRGIIREEREHLAAMRSELSSDTVLRAGAKYACQIENKLYAAFSSELEAALQ